MRNGGRSPPAGVPRQNRRKIPNGGGWQATFSHRGQIKRGAEISTNWQQPYGSTGVSGRLARRERPTDSRRKGAWHRGRRWAEIQSPATFRCAGELPVKKGDTTRMRSASRGGHGCTPNRARPGGEGEGKI